MPLAQLSKRYRLLNQYVGRDQKPMGNSNCTINKWRESRDNPKGVDTIYSALQRKKGENAHSAFSISFLSSFLSSAHIPASILRLLEAPSTNFLWETKEKVHGQEATFPRSQYQEATVAS